jgi:hypothetical protein
MHILRVILIICCVVFILHIIFGGLYLIILVGRGLFKGRPIATMAETDGFRNFAGFYKRNLKIVWRTILIVLVMAMLASMFGWK